jgi:hypothetical protein
LIIIALLQFLNTRGSDLQISANQPRFSKKKFKKKILKFFRIFFPPIFLAITVPQPIWVCLRKFGGSSPTGLGGDREQYISQGGMAP